MRKTVILTLAFSMLLTACDLFSGGEDPGSVEANLRSLEYYEKELSRSSAEFSLDLFHQLYKPDEANQFYSPYSIHQMLSMAMNGNEGEVLKEFQEVLRYRDMSLEEANKGAKDLTEFLLDVDPKVKLTIANALWYKEGYQVQVPYKNTSEEFFKAEVADLDMANPHSVNIINTWIAQQTNNMIKDMLNEINPDAAMYLVNAIYFKGDWKYQFDAKNTKKENFLTVSGSSVQVDMMDSKDKLSLKSYYENGLAYVEIPYSTGQYSLGVVFNPEGDLNSAVAKLNLDNLSKWRNSASENKAILKMPKFSMHHKINDLNSDLEDLGLKSPFVPSHDNFTKLFSNPTDKLAISRILHDAVIIVDEKGTEASAATIGEIVEVSLSLIELNKPFVFFIQEKHSGSILFMGKLGDPSLL